MLWARKYSESTLSHSPVISHYPDFLGNSPRCNKEMYDSDSSALRLIPCLIPCHVSVVKISVIWSLLARVPALSQGLGLITRRWLPRPGWQATCQCRIQAEYSPTKRNYSLSARTSQGQCFVYCLSYIWGHWAIWLYLSGNPFLTLTRTRRGIGGGGLVSGHWWYWWYYYRWKMAENNLGIFLLGD